MAARSATLVLVTVPSVTEVFELDEGMRRSAHADEGVTGVSSPIVVRVSLKGREDGECRIAIGRGDTLLDALDFAVESAPSHTRWRVTGWNEY